MSEAPLYLAHEQPSHLKTLQWTFAHGPTVILAGVGGV